jgi:hypothetical protein
MWQTIGNEVFWIERSRERGEIHCILERGEDNIYLTTMWEKWTSLHLALEKCEAHYLDETFNWFKRVSYCNGLFGLNIDPKRLDEAPPWKNIWREVMEKKKAERDRRKQ